ncbi:MAG: PHP domain-containing protein [Verrucomicrobiales bacterium]|nr:PHP domain-containing protein [Verrucomicrobiales bacterium]MCP5526478.1 PHP domain-containing protein [Verrucomicrobiales bacterium]
MFADLHTHTRFSDGTYTPEELAAQARQVGLGAIALTDHDTVEGCPRMAEACAGEGLDFVAGTELTAEQDGSEVHILGYFLAIDHPRLRAEMRRFQQVRQNRIGAMTERLQALGVALTAEQVFAVAQCDSPGRPHVARALVQAGVCRNPDEAFDRFLKQGRPAWVPKCRVSAGDAIALIHEAGGVASLAHPGLLRRDELIPALADLGLDGLECLHSRHTRSQTRRYEEIANECRLLITGGSDCHGLSKGRPLIGTVKLSHHHFERLRDHALTTRRRAPHTASP